MKTANSKAKALGAKNYKKNDNRQHPDLMKDKEFLALVEGMSEGDVRAAATAYLDAWFAARQAESDEWAKEIAQKFPMKKAGDSSTLRSRLIRLAHRKPELRPVLLPLLKERQ